MQQTEISLKNAGEFIYSEGFGVSLLPRKMHQDVMFNNWQLKSGEHLGAYKDHLSQTLRCLWPMTNSFLLKALPTSFNRA